MPDPLGPEYCLKCGRPARKEPQITFLGFRVERCGECGHEEQLPLASKYRAAYRLVLGIVLLGAIAFALEGEVFFPGWGLLIVGWILVKDARLRRVPHQGEDGGKSEGGRIAGSTAPLQPGGSGRIVMGVALLLVAGIVLFPPWRAEGIRTSGTSQTTYPYLSSEAVDTFRWSIPYAALLSPPADPSILDGVLKEELSRAESRGTVVSDSALAQYFASVRRMEARAHIPYQLSVEGRGEPHRDGYYTVTRVSYSFEIDVLRLILTIGVVLALAAGSVLLLRSAKQVS